MLLDRSLGAREGDSAVSITEQEEDEPSEEEICGLHEIPFRPWKGCPACNEEADDRAYQDLLDRKAEPHGD